MGKAWNGKQHKGRKHVKDMVRENGSPGRNKKMCLPCFFSSLASNFLQTFQLAQDHDTQSKEIALNASKVKASNTK